MMGCERPGMVRIGQWDKAQRRSLWARVLPPMPEPPDEEPAPEMSAAFEAWLEASKVWRPLAVELCAGREGDDAFVRLEVGQPGFEELVNVVRYAIGNLEGDVP